MTMRFSASALRSSIIKFVIPVMVEENVARYVPPQGGSRLETKIIQVLFALTIQTILPGLEIKNRSSSHKSKNVSTLLIKNEEVVARIQGQKDIPPKLPDRIVEQVARVHSIHR